MDISEIDAAIEQAIGLLREARDAARLLRPADYRREDAMEIAYHRIGGSIANVRGALGAFREAVRRGTNQ